MTMGHFRKRPVIVEAERFDGTLQGKKAIEKFVGERLCCEEREQGLFIYIPTAESGHEAAPGDWIVKGEDSEFYPVKPQVFKQTYDQVF
jgi:hypothetical protein